MGGMYIVSSQYLLLSWNHRRVKKMLLGCLSSPICLPQTDLLAGKGLGAAAGFAHVCALCIVGIPFESFSGLRWRENAVDLFFHPLSAGQNDPKPWPSFSRSKFLYRNVAVSRFHPVDLNLWWCKAAQVEMGIHHPFVVGDGPIASSQRRRIGRRIGRRCFRTAAHWHTTRVKWSAGHFGLGGSNDSTSTPQLTLERNMKRQ